MQNNYPVYITECPDYDEAKLTDMLRRSFDALGIDKALLGGRRVLIKPNLVLAKAPDHGATTHPAFVSAVARVALELGAASVTVADSPGGPYNAQTFSNTARTCGITDAVSKLSSEFGNVKLNDDFSYSQVYFDGRKLKTAHLIAPFMECDAVIDLCKLKTHTLTKMSCATKNLFGLIPGVEKFEMHSNFPRVEDFSEMLVDLAEYVTREKTFIAVCDAVVSMEGNGPSYGTPKKTGYALVSRSPFALDVAAEHMMKADGDVIYLNKAAERGLVARSLDGAEVLGAECPVFDFIPPDTDAGKFLKNLPDIFGGRLAGFFETKPHVDKKKCIGCGVCVRSCPKHTIVLTGKKGHKKAKIERKSCIKCFCCGELCPHGAVDAKQNPLIKLIH